MGSFVPGTPAVSLQTSASTGANLLRREQQFCRQRLVGVVGSASGGLLGCCVLVWVGGRAARVPGAVPPSSWLGLLGEGATGAPSPVAGAVEIVAVALLVLCWWRILVGARQLSPRVVMAIGAVWATPLALGPPLLSLDAYSYLAQGRLAAIGLDPYRHAPAALTDSVWLQGVDPFWRHSLSPYGPLAVLLEHTVTLTGNPVLSLVLLHLLALLCLSVVAASLMRLTNPSYRSAGLLLGVVNPLVLLQVLGAAHWEALLVALLAAALLAWHRAHPLTAMCLASAATAVKLPAGFAVAVLLVTYVLAARPRRRLAASAAATAAAVAPWALLGLWVPNPLGFLGALSAPLDGRTLYAPTTLLAEAVAKLAAVSGVGVPFDPLLSLCRVVGLLTAAAICCALLATGTRRSVAATIGAGLLVVALLGPVLYPWYGTWGLIPLVIAYPQARHRLAVLISVLTFTALPGCHALAPVIPTALSAIGLAVLAAWSYRRHRRGSHPPGTQFPWPLPVTSTTVHRSGDRPAAGMALRRPVREPQAGSRAPTWIC